jgi:hypothetical protein
VLDVRRREFITLLGGAAVAWPLAAGAQQTKVYRIGALLVGNADVNSFRTELREELQIRLCRRTKSYLRISAGAWRTKKLMKRWLSLT